jgi:hypothetical protein
MIDLPLSDAQHADDRTISYHEISMQPKISNACLAALSRLGLITPPFLGKSRRDRSARSR